MAAERKTIPLVLGPKLAAEAKLAADELEMPQSETLRLALRAGFAMLRGIKYDVGEAIFRASEAATDRGEG